MTAAVVATGLGCVGPWGIGPDALERAARAGIEPVEVDRSAGHHRPGSPRLALLVPADLAALGELVPAAAARRMSPPARLALAAARLALADAGLPAEAVASEATAVVVGTAFGPASVTERILEQIFGQGPESVSPALFTESVASASAAQIAIALRARGASIAITEREASDLLALAAGARLVASGAAARALVVVVDEMVPLLHAVLGRFRALARPEADGRERALPFGRGRTGALAAEGATVVLLESAAAAAARGRAALARVAAAVRAFDPSAPAWGYGRGDEALARTLVRGLERAGCAPESIELVVSGASGSPAGDRLEARVLRRLWPSPAERPRIVAPKGTLGGWGGGHLAAALRIASGGAFAPAVAGESEPGLGVELAREVPRAPSRTLVSSLGSAGAAAWIVLERGQPTPARAV